MGATPVLIIAQTFPPMTASGGARPFRFYKYLPRHGRPVTVITDNPELQAQSAPGVYRTPADSAKARWVQRWFLPYDEDLPWVPKAVEQASQLIEDRQISTVLSTHPPVASHLVALWLKRRYPQLHWVSDFRDPLYGNPFRRRRWLFPYDQILERHIIHTADRVLANTDALLETWRSRYPEARSKMTLLWNGYDPEDAVQPVPLQPHPRPVILHAGALYGGRHPGAFLESMKRIAPPDAYDIRFLGANESERVSRNEANRQIAEADFLLLLDLNETGESIQVPAKLFDYICARRPIIAFTNPGSPTARILEQSGVDSTVIYTNQNPDGALAQFLRRGCRTTEARPWFFETFNGERQAAALAALLPS